MTDNAFIWIHSEAALQEHVSQWVKEPCIAIDTEFVRENTFYANAGLVQLATHDGVYLIDPLEVTDLSALAPLLESDSCIKIMHSMSEDIELLYHVCGAIPTPIFDTQVAAAFLGLGPSLGYQALVEKVLGIELDKSETRSDWLKRPLTDSQILYAAKDAEYLVSLYDALMQQLNEKGLADSVLNECDFVVKQSKEVWLRDDIAYLKLRAAWDLSAEKQYLLQKVVEWRDKTAKQNNIPKPWVFSDVQLIEALRYQAESFSELKRLDRVKSKSIRLFGEQLIDWVKTLNAAPPQIDDDFCFIEKPIRGRELDTFKRLKKVVKQVSAETGIEPQLLGSRKMLENIVIHMCRHKHNELPEEYLGWRYPLLGEKLKAALVGSDQ